METLTLPEIQEKLNDRVHHSPLKRKKIIVKIPFIVDIGEQGFVTQTCIPNTDDIHGNIDHINAEVVYEKKVKYLERFLFKYSNPHIIDFPLVVYYNELNGQIGVLSIPSFDFLFGKLIVLK